MTKKLLKQLVDYSYKKNEIILKNVNDIVKHLSRNELKQYIRDLKIQERKVSVFIEAPTNYEKIKDEFREMFPDKKIVLGVDTSLMLGARILANDMLFELNLKNSLDRILLSIKEDYD